MPPKALSRFAERGAGWRKPPPTSALDFSLRTIKDGDRHTSCGRVAVIAARRGTVCGEVGRVPGFPQLTVRSLYEVFLYQAPGSGRARPTHRRGSESDSCSVRGRGRCEITYIFDRPRTLESRSSRLPFPPPPRRLSRPPRRRLPPLALAPPCTACRETLDAGPPSRPPRRAPVPRAPIEPPNDAYRA